jgi:predicted kinase
MTEKRPGVAFYGKVRIPTIGHRKAIDTAKGIAKKVGGHLRIGLSGTSKPLTSETKKAHAEMMFNHPVDTGDEHSKNLFSYLSHLNQHHDEIHLVAGSDRAPEYRRTLKDWNGKADKSGKVGFNFKKWKVHEVEGTRGDVNKHPTEMNRDELERSVSATKLEGLAKSGDYDGFKSYHPGFPDKHVKKVYNQIRMSSSETPAPKTVKQIKSKKIIKEELNNHSELNHEKFGPMLDTFVQFASKQLGIKSMPTMKLEKEPMSTSFGGYSPAEKSIVVITKNRHPMDIYRTVAHELVHHKQNEDGRLGKDIRKEGSTGSPIENEANAEAGKVMRWFAKANPEMFKTGYVTESCIEEGIQDPAKGKAIFMAGGPGSGKDFIMGRTLVGHGLTEINSDNALEHLMRMRGLDPMMPKEEDYERNLARGTAKKITKEKERLALAGRRGVIINGTADDPEKIATIKKHLEDNGYETKMLFVNTSDEVSRQRNFERGLGGGRKVPDGTDKSGRPDGTPDIRKEKWQAAQEAKNNLKKLFGDDHFIHVDNSEDYRKVDDNRKKEIDKSHNQLFKHYRQFTSTPAQTEKSKEWIESEKKKRGITQYKPAKSATVSQRKPVAPYVPNASELEQAKRLGVQHVGGGQFGSKEGTTHVTRSGQLTSINEDLRKWFKEKWVRFDTKGNIKGPCAREPGEGKPKCRPMASAVSMSKEARAKAAKRKRREDPVADRKGKGGKPIFVKTESVQTAIDKINKDRMSEAMLVEKNVPTNPELWSKAKSLAKQKFDVYPSAYANGWASKWYKSKGGGWKSKVDENFEKMVSENTPSDREWGKTSTVKIYTDSTPGQTFPANPLSEKIMKKKKKLAQEDNVIPRGGIGQDGIGDQTTVYRPMVASGYGGAGTIPMYESIVNWMNNPKTQERFIAKYGDNAEQKLYEAAEKLNELDFIESGPKFFTHLREAWEAKGGRDMGTVPNQGKEEVYEDDVIKPSKTLRGYKKNVHPMSTFEKKALAEDIPEVINERGADSKGLYRSTESGAGLTRKGAKKFGVKTAVTTPPSKLDPKGKAAKRRKSFCARMGGMPGPMKDEKGRPTRKAMSLRRWNCEE